MEIVAREGRGTQRLTHVLECQLELAELVVELTGSRSKLVFRPLPADDPKQRRPDISRAEAELGWRPTTALREGLEKTIGYFEELLRQNDEPNDIGAGRAALALNGG